eukprot:TRINITY_DN5872_c0_g1_i1.p1 TRINITY_DN5872_c0_g1~~TRINITY_DN5872_c0_g1_i1.p1  ORF type:complete len:624 (+),score=120.32 TRINITY_DN5872_c0_g1_i1:83-1954(+)
MTVSPTASPNGSNSPKGAMVRARPISAKALRGKVLSEHIGELKSEINNLMLRHQGEVNSFIDNWAQVHQSQSPKLAQSWPSLSGSPDRRHLDTKVHLTDSMEKDDSLQSRPTTPGFFSRPTTPAPLPPSNGSSVNLPQGVPDSLGKKMGDIEEVCLPGEAAEGWNIETLETVEAETTGEKEAVKTLALPDSSVVKSRKTFHEMFSPAPVFMDTADLKARLKESLSSKLEHHDDYLHSKGWAQHIVRHAFFEYATLFIILTNAVWMGYDADYNEAPSLAEADLQFVIIENFFCIYFLWEWIVRLAAFSRKVFALQDAWFVFDTLLVSMMVIETWILPMGLYLVVEGKGMKGMQAIRWFRLLRLTRLARVARLVRAFPELLILCKAILISTKTVVYTFVLLIVTVYVFAIAFTLLLEGRYKEEDSTEYVHFRGVLVSMNTLLLSGALPDQAGLVDSMLEKSVLYYFIMLVYLLIASLTLMNMLIGILCEVIGAVSALEKEDILLQRVKTDLKEMMEDLGIGEDNGNSLSKRDFSNLLIMPRAAHTLDRVGVDVVGLVDFTDYIFSETNETVSFTDFMDLVLQLRGSNTATVKDIIDLRKKMMGICPAIQEMLDMKLGPGNLPQSF